MFREIYERAAASAVPEYATEALACQFATLAKTLEERGRVMNLTAITEPDAVVKLHIIDSLYAARALESVMPSLPSSDVADVGSGAGFPALPIAAAVPAALVTAIDSTEKKCAYIGDCAARMGLSNVTAVSGRAEELARGVMRDSFGAVTSRAVARLSVLVELCLPLVAPGGVFLAMKGAAADEEEREAANAVNSLGAELERREKYSLDGYADERTILIYRKTAPTPDAYPRHFSKISKAPL